MAKRGDAETHASEAARSKLFRDLQLGFVKVHVLHHASIGPIYGSGISAELQTHGYRLSWGTLYPVLHSLEAAGFLVRDERVVDGKVRKYYLITPAGRRALRAARRMALELVDEISEPAKAQPAAATSVRTRGGPARRT
jgi:DNA-binding PadR family transcriptional regulator